MSWTGSVIPWLPTLLVIIVTAAALTTATSAPATRGVRRLWTASIFVFGSLAITGAVWQGRTFTDEFRALSGTTFPTNLPNTSQNDATIFDLSKKVKALEDQVRELEASRQVRTIAPETAEKLAGYLQQFGDRRIVVSCIPDDIEAYQYANQIVNILKAANWNAQGPEITKIFGEVRALGINLYVNGDHHSDTVNILLDGFRKFNIPYQSRVTPSQAIPDTETVELFIGAKPSEHVSTTAD